MKIRFLVLPFVLLALLSCNPAPTATADQTADETAPGALATDQPRLDYAIAIHGGAGVIPKDMEEERKQEYFDALEEALRAGQEQLESGAAAMDVVENVVRILEDVPLFNAGKGSVFTAEGKNELDAAIMDGSNRDCGAVSGLTSVKNPISLARMVMEKSPHVFFQGDGAEVFADEMGVERVEQEYYYTEHRWQSLQNALERQKAAGGDGVDFSVEKGTGDEKYGTVGCVVLDKNGNLAAGTSTGGMTAKRFGRVGDVPIIGAGTYADNKTAAISGTGKGEQFIRHTVARSIAALMEYQGKSLNEAAEAVVHGDLDKGDGGIIAVSRTGEIALVFNSPGMFRGAADSTGRFDVAIWED